MPSFEEHVHQARRNLDFLQHINSKINDCDDWQVTVCFYSGLHLINAHIAKFDLQYRKHKDVEHAINPYNITSVCKLSEDVFVAYQNLQVLSRRSRYLVNVRNGQTDNAKAHLTNSKHLSKALKHLDVLMSFFSKVYGVPFENVRMSCIDFKQSPEVKFITKISAPAL
ncbi:MAG: hypothetical protein U0T73_05205 [Chitinophagales bacterium]